MSVDQRSNDAELTWVREVIDLCQHSTLKLSAVVGAVASQHRVRVRDVHDALRRYLTSREQLPNSKANPAAACALRICPDSASTSMSVETCSRISSIRVECGSVTISVCCDRQ